MTSKEQFSKNPKLIPPLIFAFYRPRRQSLQGMQNSIDYIEAEDRGRSIGGCFDKYGRCPLTIRRLLPDNYVEVMKKR